MMLHKPLTKTEKILIGVAAAVAAGAAAAGVVAYLHYHKGVKLALVESETDERADASLPDDTQTPADEPFAEPADDVPGEKTAAG